MLHKGSVVSDLLEKDTLFDNNNFEVEMETKPDKTKLRAGTKIDMDVDVSSQ